MPLLLRQYVSNELERDVATIDHGIIGNAQDAMVLRTQPDRPALIVNFPFRRVMRRAIEFNDQFCLDAQEIADIIADRNLPSEFMTFESRPAQRAPENCLGNGHSATKRRREGQYRLFRAPQHKA